MDYKYIYKYKEDTGYDVSNHNIDNFMYYSEDFVEWLQEQLNLVVVSQQRELLIAFCEYAKPIYWGENEYNEYEQLIDPFIKSNL